FPLLQALYKDYKQVLKECRFYEYKNIPIAYPVKMNLKPVPVKTSFLHKFFRKMGNGFHKLAKKV
ncbi:MAG: hypothetical protein AAFP76_16785, partial [Bacteroidota bacterium]